MRHSLFALAFLGLLGAQSVLAGDDDNICADQCTGAGKAKCMAKCLAATKAAKGHTMTGQTKPPCISSTDRTTVDGTSPDGGSEKPKKGTTSGSGKE